MPGQTTYILCTYGGFSNYMNTPSRPHEISPGVIKRGETLVEVRSPVAIPRESHVRCQYTAVISLFSHLSHHPFCSPHAPLLRALET